MARGKKKESALTPEEKLAQALVPVEEQPYKVPENWCWVKLSALSTLISKGTTPTGGKNAYVSEGVHFLRVENINDDGTISHDNIACVTEQMHTGFLKRSVLENRDVLVSIAGTLGKTGIVRDIDLPLNTNQAVAFVRLKTEDVNERYIKGVIDNPITQELLLGKTKVTSIPNLTLEIIGDCLIPLAPIAEQQRIVDRIEYLFAKLDETKEKAQSVLDSFETRKAAILHKAFTGELTAKWRAEHGLDMGSWKLAKFSDVLDVRDGTHDSPQYYDTGYPLVTSKNLKDGRITDKDIKYICQEDYDKINERSKVDIGDILFAMIGTIGNPVVVQAEPHFAIKNMALFKSVGKINPFFVKYYLESKTVMDKMQKEAKGSTQKFVALGYLRAFPIDVPMEQEQDEVVRILDSLFAKEQQAKEAAEAVLEKIDLMKKSILARAFRGELGTNDPKDKSAVELLKKVI